jgi:shikimate dehydrogenase
VLRLGAKDLIAYDRDPSRAEELAERLNKHHTGRRARATTDLGAALARASGLIHATPTGMGKMNGMPFPETLLRPGLWVSEIVYVPLETELLKAARRRGCQAIDGGHMNVGQAARAFKLFTGLEADAARMEARFRRLAG